MTNRERLEAAARDEIRRQTRLGKEIEYYVEALESGDLADAFDNAIDVAEHNGDKATAKAAVDLLIKVGYYQPRRGEVVTMGRDRAPLRKGIRYDAELTLEQWLDKED